MKSEPFGQSAIAQILAECQSGARTLDPAFEIATGLTDKGYLIVPRKPTRAMIAAWEDLEPEDLLEADFAGLWAQLVAAGRA